MIWSVSMLVTGSATVRERICLTAGMCLVGREFPWVGYAAADRRGGRGFGRGEQRARAGSLAAFEVAVARADGIVARGHEVAVHAEAHRAAALAPLGAGVEEHAMQSFRFGRALDE